MSERKNHCRVVFLLVLAMVAQIVCPVAQQVYAAMAPGSFRVVNEEIRGSTAYIDWELTLDLEDVVADWDHMGRFTLEDGADPIEDEELLAEGGERIGSYSISSTGKLYITIDDEIYQDLREATTESPEVDMGEADRDVGDENSPTDPQVGEEGDDAEPAEGDPADAPTEDEGDGDPISDTEGEAGEEEDPTELEDDPADTKTASIASSEKRALPPLVETEDDGEGQTEPTVYRGTIEVPHVVEKEPPLDKMKNFMMGIFSTSTEWDDIFEFSFLKYDNRDGANVEDGAVIEISDGTTLWLEYTWSTGEKVKAGDTAKIEVPDAFKLGKNWEDLVIFLSDGTTAVGKYSLVDNVVTFVFDEGIEAVSGVSNGFVGFGIEFDLDKFKTDVVAEIEFKDVSDKTFTIIRDPKMTIKSIFKTGVPDAEKDAKKITWTIDIANSGDEDIENATLSDTIPPGLKLDEDSFEVKELTVGSDGKFHEAGDYSVAPDISTDSWEIKFVDISRYRGYRVKYTTTITDYSEGAFFTNKAELKVGSEISFADATVKKLPRSDLIEKEGEYLDGDVIEWKVYVNKPHVGIEYAKIYENLPTGLTLVGTTVELYKPTKSGESWSDGSEFEDVDITGTDGEFTVDLGEIATDQAYMVKFKTEIDYSEINDGEYEKEGNVFTNTAVLQDGGGNELGSAEGSVTIDRAPIIEKTEIKNIGYNDKTLTWQLEINEAQHPMSGVEVVDTLPAGLGITKDNIQIYEHDGNTVASEFPSDKSWIDINPGAENMTVVTMTLGDIGTDHYKIKYTVDVEDFGIGSFKNQAEISGTGTGIGDTWKYSSNTISVAENSYTKISTGIDYSEKTISWKIKVDPLREHIKELAITDSFPNKGLIFLKDTLVVEQGGKTLAEETDYSLTENIIDEKTQHYYNQGFIIEFTNITETNPLADEVITITFETSFDPEEGIEESTSIEVKDKYQNEATFSGETLTRAIDTSVTAKRSEREESWNTGKKVGKLVSASGEEGWKSGDERKIRWEFYINYLEQKLGKGVVVEDELQYDGAIDVDSVKVYEYAVKTNGDTEIDKDKLLDSSNYALDVDGKDLKLTFKDDFEVSKRYVVVYTTSVPKISKGTYTNEAVVNVSGKISSYTGSVSFGEHDKNLSKKANVSGENVYTDEELDWEVIINESLSIVEKDVQVVDTISAGLVYKSGSLKIEEKQRDGTWEAFSYYSLEVSPGDAGKTIITINFNDSISSTYKITYTTVVVAQTGNVNNTVEYSGTNLEEKTVETEELKAQLFTYVGGVGGDPAKGKIKVTKVDEGGNTITNTEAEFELWYKLNDGDVRFQDTAFETENGELEIVNLPLGRTYYLKEVKAPTGFVLNTDETEIPVEKSSSAKVYEVEVENTKIKGYIVFTKVDDLDSKVKDAEFTLYDEAGINLIKDEGGNDVIATSDADGEVKFSDVPYGQYTIKETKTPDGYLPNSEVLYAEIVTNGQETIPKRGSITGSEVSEFTNIVMKGNIQLTKVDESDGALAGAVIGLYKAPYDKNDTPQDTTTSYNDGKVIFSNVPYGDYVIKEITAPVGYAPSDKEIKVSIENDGETIVVAEKIINEKIIGDIEVIKYGEDDSTTLAGAVFVLEQSGVVKYTSDETDSNGRYVFEDIEYGTYTLREITPPEGYNLSTAEETVTISEKDQGIIRKTFTNTKIRGDIQLTKVDAYGNPLHGVVFALFDESENPIVGTDGKAIKAISGNDGIAVFSDIPYGKYKVGEIATLPGYKLELDKLYDVSITDDGVIVTKDIGGEDLTAVNIGLGRIKIVKVDARDHAHRLSKAEFEIRNSIGKLVASATTDDSGEAMVKNLEYGSYTVAETKAPPGYRADDTEHIITVDGKGGGKNIEALLTVENRRIPSGGGGKKPEEPEKPEEPKEKPGDPKEPEEPEQPKDPTPPEDPKDEDPKEVVEEETPKDTPKEGDVEVPEGGEPKVKEPPKNGTVEVDEKGKWKYTPNPGFEGKDSFTITVVHPDGTVEDIIFEIDVQTPLGEGEDLPKVGEMSPIAYYLLGALLILLGLYFREKRIA